MDKTKEFFNVARSKGWNPSLPKRQRTSSPANQEKAFFEASAYVSSQISILSQDVTMFAKKSKNKSVFNSEAEMGTETKRIQDQLQKLKDGIKALDNIHRQSLSRGQLQKHCQQVIICLKKKAEQYTRLFSTTVQSRAKAVTKKEERLRDMFGDSGVRDQPFNKRPVVNSSQQATPFGGPTAQTTYNRLSTSAALSQMPSSTSHSPVAQSTPHNNNTSHTFQSNRRQMHFTGVQTARGNPYQGLRQRKKDTPATGFSQRQPPSGPSFAPTPVQQYADKSYLQSRGQEVHNIEKQVASISELMTDFAIVLEDQTETIGRIEDDVNTADTNINAGLDELMKYYNGLTGDRAMIIKIFIIVIIISVLFILMW